MSMLEIDVERASSGNTTHHGRRVLLVSYHFPPVGGGGVQRQVKFAKYLQEFGWQVSVLVAENPSAPVRDGSLVRDIPDNLHIERAHTWEPGYGMKQAIAAQSAHSPDPADLATFVKRRASRFVRGAAGVFLQPDPQVLWIPDALRAGSRLLARVPHDAILASAPAYSNLLLGSLLKQRFGLPLIVDFRDEWEISWAYLENRQRDALSRAVQGWMQGHVFRQADAILATTKASAARLKARAEQMGSRAEATCIYNGYDETDFRAQPADAKTRIDPKQGFRIVYTGTLWNLTSAEPLVRAVQSLHARAPEALRRLELVFVGRRTPEQHAILSEIEKLSCRLRVVDYCDHDESLAWVASADALCLLLSDVAEANRVIPAKLFEYLRAHKEILAIAPDGEAVEIMRQHRAGAHFQPGDIEGIAGWLSRRVSGYPSPPMDPASLSAIKQFSRERQSRQLADILDGLTVSAPRDARPTSGFLDARAPSIRADRRSS